MRSRWTATCGLLLWWAAKANTAATAQTVINGDALAFQSSGNANGSGWTLDSDGYVGTYIQLSSPAAVTLSANAAVGSSNSPAADLTFSIADDNNSQTVSSTTAGNVSYTTPVLPAGTYFVRTQLDNSATPTSDTNLTSLGSASSSAPSLTINSLSVSGTGVTVLNQNTTANATSAATTYEDNFRSGAASVHLQLPGGQSIGSGVAANVKLTSNAFNFALAVPGQSYNFQNEDGGSSGWINYNTSTGVYTAPTAGTTAYTYQQKLLQNFNMVVPTNAGKWQNNEASQGSVNMSLADAITQFASQNGLSERMHNLIWWNQQPSFINNLFGTTSNSTPSAANLQTIQTDVNNRIQYYVKGTNPGLGTLRADSYEEMDVLNEPVHSDLNSVTDSTNGGTTTYNNDHYQQYLGVNGVAQIYSEAASAVAAAGANTRLYTNEYNVLQNSSNPNTNGNDPYANWYLNEVTQLNSTSYGKVVTGVGSELYVSYNSSNNTTGALSPATMMQALQNLAVAGNPISLTEFGESTVNAATPTAQAFANDLVTALNMIYGDPQATTFGFWGGLGGPVDANSITSLYDSNWNLTVVGQAYQQWMSQWETNLNLSTDANGNLNFTGTYGTYELTINGQQYQFTISPGNTNVTLTLVPEPAAWLLAPAAALLCGRRRNRASGRAPLCC